ncbi:MAG: DUF4169 family protein [Sphingomonas sp.]
MADIVNLNRARKTKQRAEAGVVAATNRARFGRTKQQKRDAAEEAARQERVLDGARREP